MLKLNNSLCLLSTVHVRRLCSLLHWTSISVNPRFKNHDSSIRTRIFLATCGYLILPLLRLLFSSSSEFEVSDICGNISDRWQRLAARSWYYFTSYLANKLVSSRDPLPQFRVQTSASGSFTFPGKVRMSIKYALNCSNFWLAVILLPKMKASITKQSSKALCSYAPMSATALSQGPQRLAPNDLYFTVWRNLCRYERRKAFEVTSNS